MIWSHVMIFLFDSEIERHFGGMLVLFGNNIIIWWLRKDQVVVDQLYFEFVHLSCILDAIIFLSLDLHFLYGEVCQEICQGNVCMCSNKVDSVYQAFLLIVSCKICLYIILTL
eukprot:TRINITY_DN622_c0_g1_i2.p4 TRINITY_DN622_c0_g1~~TRINITY_DN622_c0_g1_i2.p4  ORF type:complete len:113 (-),score=4.70 TRINITY_DN622_c0_g1_i2:55-393(-)